MKNVLVLLGFIKKERVVGERIGVRESEEASYFLIISLGEFRLVTVIEDGR